MAAGVAVSPSWTACNGVAMTVADFRYSYGLVCSGFFYCVMASTSSGKRSFRATRSTSDVLKEAEEEE